MTASLLGLLLGFIGSMPVAGPIALLVLRKGLRGHYSEGIALAMGAAISEAVYCALALLGFDYLFVRYPIVESASRIIGGLLLIGLGIGFALMKAKDDPTDGGTPQASSKATPFLTGLTVAGLNPTLMVTWSGVAAIVYSTFGAFGEWEKVGFPIGVGIGNFLWFVVMLMLMKRYRSRFQTTSITRGIKAVGIIMTGMGGWMLWTAFNGN
jgi:threonine/homoserine/homoserine lactone efflux protein